jgi:RNA polymerase sigma-70 factor (ECF subfamily)
MMSAVPAGSSASEIFEEQRPRLLGLAYRLLGSVADAEDVVQEAWFRFDRVDLASIARPAAWLTTVTSRLGLDKLRARQRDRLDYVGPWLPEPIVESTSASAVGIDAPSNDPADQAELADSLTTAFLVLLERLSPQERLAVLLADVFGEPFTDIAAVLDISDVAVRQLASRARRKLRDGDPTRSDRRPSPLAEQQLVATQLVAALVAGDIAATARLLAPDVVVLSDGGALVHAARRPVVGADRVSRFMINLAKRAGAASVDETDFCVVNNQPALIARQNGTPRFVVITEVVDGLVHRIHVVNNPAKLAALDHPVDLR